MQTGAALRAVRMVANGTALVAAALILRAHSAYAAAPADLQLRAVAKSFQVGTVGTYSLTIVNEGPAATDEVIMLNDQLPDGLSFVSASGGWTCSAAGQAVTCENPTSLGAGHNTTFTLDVFVGSAAFPGVVNRLTIAYAGDPNTGNNTIVKSTSVKAARGPIPASPTARATVTPIGGTAAPTRTPTQTATATATRTPVPAATDLALLKTTSGTFSVGTNGVYTLTVTNIGSVATNTGITVVDTLPSSLGFVSATGTNWTCSAAQATVACTNVEPLAASATSSITLTVSVSSAAAPTVTNSATLSYAGDTNAANNLARKPTTVRAARHSVRSSNRPSRVR